MVGCLRNALLFDQSRHNEIWGADLKHAEDQALKTNLENVGV